MKILQISAENFLGVINARLDLVTPVTLVAGHNAAGKSSLQEAMRMALTGETVRVSLKKDYVAMVSAGAQQGFAQVVMRAPDGSEGSATVMLPSGKSSATNYTPPDALPYVLNAQRFARLEDKERRAFLFGLMGLKTDVASVKARMLAKGLDASRVERILPMLRAGFDAASKDAKTKATEAKGAWRSATSENYGSDKAKTWRAPAPEVDEKALASLSETVAKLDKQIAEANQKLGGLQADKRRYDEQLLRASAARATASNLERNRTKLATDEAGLADAIAKVQELDGTGSPQTALECPGCKARLVVKDGVLVHAEEKAARPDAGRLTELIRARDLMQNSVNNSRRDLAEAERAVQVLQELETAAKAAPTASDVEAAQQKVQALQAERAQHAGNLDALEKAHAAAAAAEALTAKAAQHHADVVAWDAIGDALAPDGIPSEMLAEALSPINDRLDQSALDAEWPRVEIDKDMVITAGGRAYRLLSESEQWRVDAMLAEAVSFQSGLKLLVLDRFDVLDTKGRTDLLAWLHVLAENKEVETALVFGTLKALPADVPATVGCEWIENGRVGQLKEAA